MDKNQPQRNIMRTGEWQGADAYRVACECHDPDHDLDVWVEVESDTEVQEVTLTLYKDLYSPTWEPGFNRFREALRLLFTGRTRVTSSIIMKRDVAQNFIKALQTSIDRLESKS